MDQNEVKSEKKKPDDHAIASGEELVLTNLEVAEQHLRDSINSLTKAGLTVPPEMEAQLRAVERDRKAFQHLLTIDDPDLRERALAGMHYGDYPPEALAGPESFIVEGSETLQ